MKSDLNINDIIDEQQIPLNIIAEMKKAFSALFNKEYGKAEQNFQDVQKNIGVFIELNISGYGYAHKCCYLFAWIAKSIQNESSNVPLSNECIAELKKHSKFIPKILSNLIDYNTNENVEVRNKIIICLKNAEPSINNKSSASIDLGEYPHTLTERVNYRDCQAYKELKKLSEKNGLGNMFINSINEACASDDPNLNLILALSSISNKLAKDILNIIQEKISELQAFLLPDTSHIDSVYPKREHNKPKLSFDDVISNKIGVNKLFLKLFKFPADISIMLEEAYELLSKKDFDQALKKFQKASALCIKHGELSIEKRKGYARIFSDLREEWEKVIDKQNRNNLRATQITTSTTATTTTTTTTSTIPESEVFVGKQRKSNFNFKIWSTAEAEEAFRKKLLKKRTNPTPPGLT